MILLILGLALWWGAHLYKRMAPHPGPDNRRKGIVALALVASVILMTIGYQRADVTMWWAAGPALKGINNLLVLVAFFLFASAGIRNRIGTQMRHPQLTGFSLWAFAHLLTNGDLPSVVLFGGLLLWALVEIVVINRAQPNWTPPPHQTSIRKEAMAAVGAVVVYLVVGLIHAWLGVNPFGA